jgi:ferrous iron transport protein A
LRKTKLWHIIGIDHILLVAFFRRCVQIPISSPVFFIINVARGKLFVPAESEEMDMTTANIPLSEAKMGSILLLTRIEVQGVMRRRLLDLGFVPENEVEVLQRSPLGDPIAFRVNNTTIALRKEESSLIYGTIMGGGE